MRYRVFDNVLSSDEHESILNPIINYQMPFYYGDTVTSKSSLPPHDYSFQFYNMVYSNHTIIDHQCFNLLLPIINFINPSALRRVKINLTPRTPSNLPDKMHVDFTDSSNFYSAVYYINSNNGGTLFEEGGVFISSEANKLLVFEGHNRHTNVTCTDQNIRMIVNFVFYCADDSIFSMENYNDKR